MITKDQGFMNIKTQIIIKSSNKIIRLLKIYKNYIYIYIELKVLLNNKLEKLNPQQNNFNIVML